MKENNDIVTLELAKLAKKAGFDEICDWGYCFDKTKQGYYENYDPDYFKNSQLWEKHFAAPTREQLNSWLRKHNVHVSVDFDQTYEPKFVYKVRLYQGDGNWDVSNDTWSDLYYHYVQALENGLKEGMEKYISSEFQKALK